MQNSKFRGAKRRIIYKLQISNGKWCWFSKGIGGRSALDYLIKVQGFSFMEAIEKIAGTKGFEERPAAEKPIVHSKKLLLPKANSNNKNAINYLSYYNKNEISSK